MTDKFFFLSQSDIVNTKNEIRKNDFFGFRHVFTMTTFYFVSFSIRGRELEKSHKRRLFLQEVFKIHVCTFEQQLYQKTHEATSRNLHIFQWQEQEDNHEQRGGQLRQIRSHAQRNVMLQLLHPRLLLNLSPQKL